MTSINHGQHDKAASSPAGFPPAWRCWPAIALFVGLVAVTLTADLWMKAWAFAHVAGVPVTIERERKMDPNDFIPDHPEVVVIPHVLNMKLVCNQGAVFGLGKGAQTLFILVSLVAVVVIGWSFANSRADAHVRHVALALILAGALGNLHDRIRFNAVRDMFHMLPDPVFNVRLWPWVFNIADAALMIGMGMLIVTLYLHDKQAQNAAANPR